MDGLMIGGELPAHLVQDPNNRRSMEGKVLVRFYSRTVPDAEETEKQGRPVHKSAPYVQIRVPGDRTNEPDRPVQDKDKQRFPKAWAAFIAQKEAPVSGTPLEAWPQISAPEVADLKAQRIHTVEELAAVGDAHLGNLGHNGRRIRDSARVFLEHAQGLAPLARLQAENAKKDEQIAALSAKVEELARLIPAGDDPPVKRGPGRPPKYPQSSEG
jgi:hypothetical protein